MQHPHDDIVQYGCGLPAFEIVFDRPTPMRAWLRQTSAIMGTLAWVIRP
jgi:hypothetical protein